MWAAFEGDNETVANKPVKAIEPPFFAYGLQFYCPLIMGNSRTFPVFKLGHNVREDQGSGKRSCQVLEARETLKSNKAAQYEHPDH